MFSEPAWEMILTLYAEQAGQRHSQASLVELSGRFAFDRDALDRLSG